MSVDLSAALAQDIAFVSSDAPCSRTSQVEQGWSCFRAQGDQYHGTPSRGTRLPTGPAAGPTRLMLGLELPFDAVVIGARLGWAFRGMAPATDGQEGVRPISVELTGRVRLTKSGAFRLDLLGLLGNRVLDAHATIAITEDRSAPPSVYQLDNPDKQTLDGYKRLGTGFVGLGLAGTYALGRFAALRFELPVSYFFPTSGVALTPTLAFVVTP